MSDDGQGGMHRFRIDDAAAMEPFLMALPTAGNRLLYVASTGALTAGRRDSNGAIFPYETDDRLMLADGTVGPRTVLQVGEAGAERRWEPFLRAADGCWPVRRAILKSALGDEICFEERNEELGLVFTYSWRSGAEFGFVRQASLQNLSDRPIRVRLLDGLLGLLPAAVDQSMQQGYSCLVDAYKQGELLEDAGLSLFSLSSIPVDRATPNEALLANVAWIRGLPAARILLSARQLPAFRAGKDVQQEERVRGRATSFLCQQDLLLAPGACCRWTIGIDAGLDATAVVALRSRLGPASARAPALDASLQRDLADERERLLALCADVDGLQATAAPQQDARHLANALWNAMRGGSFLADGRIDGDDFCRYVREVAPQVHERNRLDAGFSPPTRAELVEKARASGDLDLERLAREYLPLTWSRRHGDPSRPWNRFVLDTHEPDGRPKLRYEGNWRDIFQNWEALLHSFPDFAEAVVVKFLNATTQDGYNPYRVSREGFDWERPDPGDPWAHIGYWGDHQIVYLERLLRLCEQYAPQALPALARREIFVFADVPYEIAPYRRLLDDPFNTIRFDRERDAEITRLLPAMGNEARLVPEGPRSASQPLRTGLGEKLLTPILAKLSNFIPGLGIWMNTQRPEWNDANNALVGRGVSVVTTAQLLRHCAVVRRLLAASGPAPLRLSEATLLHLRATSAALVHKNQSARAVLDQLGEAGSRYRQAVRERSEAARRRADAPMNEVLELLDRAHEALAETLRQNRREDGLWHSYNLLSLDHNGAISARRLPPMLEGQVAALACGALSAEEACTLLDALRRSPLRRHDLGAYLLYPDRELPRFCDKGALLEADAAAPLMQRLCDEPRLLRRDVDGRVRFAPDLHNAEALAARCRELGLAGAEQQLLLAAYERVFDHAAFTGRSGSFFGYEGLGSVYWHMVSKLRLAVLEAWREAGARGAPPAVRETLLSHYDDIVRGLGTGLPPERYGAFPSDPYSHTPSHSGARQPGMTGQVKEDLLARRLELGVAVEDGCLRFHAALWRGEQPLAMPQDVRLGHAAAVTAPAQAIGFSVCATPVTLQRGPARAVVVLAGGERIDCPGARLDRETSQWLFSRSGRIARIEVWLDADAR